MTEATEAAYRYWRALVEIGYGSKTHPSDLARVDSRIRAAKLKYENALAREKAGQN